MRPPPPLFSGLTAFSLVLAATLAACGGTPAEPVCGLDADCPQGEQCRAGKCEAATGECTSGQRRPCGNPAVGACQRGTQACVNGTWASACSAEVTPAQETCNGVDDDCDGETDEGLLTDSFIDADGDGHGDATAAAFAACSPPAGHATSNDDCDDRPGVGAGVHPGALEVCEALGVDEDCSGSANDGCGCTAPGSTVPCCAGRGVQTCEAQDGGTALSACSVTPEAEVCNGVDDDCDGQTDEQVAVVGADGGALPVDGGVGAADGTCVAGVGACVRSGHTACAAAALVCTATPASPGVETCNGVDDDCDGQTDEQVTLVASDGGALPVAGAIGLPDGTCVAGLGVCARSGQTVCSAATLVCTATAASPGVETCNSLDDDCDGQTDEAGPGLCAIGGQVCTAGACACPSGQLVCNGACGTPATETCDGVDNDCDGQVDEGLLFVCYADTDGDLYADNTTQVLKCPDTSRGAAGFCPVGFVAPGSSPAVDCAPTNASAWRFTALRTDADNDTACVGLSLADCVGANAPAGRRFTASCNPTDDCNDANASLYRLMASRNDADADGSCAGATALDCVGTNPLPGRRFEPACLLPDDCNDANASVFRNASVRLDADGDQYCAGTAQTMCIGNAPPPGYRITTSCQGDDCKDSNASATTACTLVNQYTTSYHFAGCPGGGTFSVTAQTFCPIGFVLGAYRAQVSSGGGNCSAASPTSVTQTCNFLEGTTCRVVGDCVAQ